MATGGAKRRCDYCGDPIDDHKRSARFCDGSCKAAYHRAKEAGEAVPAEHRRTGGRPDTQYAIFAVDGDTYQRVGDEDAHDRESAIRQHVDELRVLGVGVISEAFVAIPERSLQVHDRHGEPL